MPVHLRWLSKLARGCSDTLVIYSNSVSDGRGDWLKKEAEGAGFKLQFVDLGGGDIQNRLIAEKNNPIADAVFGLNNVFFQKIKNEGVLDAYKPSWAANVDAKLGDGSQFWPIVREPIMLVYNTKAYPTPDKAPSDWTDLWTKPEFKGKYEVPTSLGGATTQMVVSGILARYRDNAGKDGVSQEGWKNIEAFFKTGQPAVKGEDLYARMKSGTVNAGQMWLAGKVQREKQYGIKTEAVKPKIGVPFAVQHVALVKGSKKAEQAKKFIDWFGGHELQGKWSKQFFTAPTNTKASSLADAEAVKATDAFTRQEIDWEFVAKNIDAWIEHIELQYMG
ncbi:extracellular solute-binding protein [Cutibacterium equinum]|uniref:Extracellular solute-binding protein n=1 Tax=Cutibacterium equinum TaxID=3016342 RepID=A0ABY7R213_9ACTN|nr:extracellular solute-binding protein [Cutibacterium equinum]WCC80914.1 extracellular solute-binding protein [Cutibacterium equinum]